MQFDTNGIITAGSIVSGFGIVVITFRLNRELGIETENRKRVKRGLPAEPTWITWPDKMILVSVMVSLSVVVLLLSGSSTDDRVLAIYGSLTSAAMSLVMFYPLAILCHYEFMSPNRSHKQVTKWERIVMAVAYSVAALILIWRFAAP